MADLVTADQSVKTCLHAGRFRLGYGAFDTVAFAESVPEERRLHTVFPRHIGESHGFSAKGEDDVVSLVSSLLEPVCPSNIARFVVARISDSVYGMIRRRLSPDFGKELLKRGGVLCNRRSVKNG